jgi:endoglucanase
MPFSAPSLPLTRRAAIGMGSATLAALAFPASQRAAASAGPSRGFSLPGWVDRTVGTAPSGAVLAKLREAGFGCVRLPVDADLISAPDRAGRRAMLDRISEATAQLIASGFGVMLDMHPSAGLGDLLQQDPEAGGTRVVDAWTLLRDLVADFPAGLVQAELLNEPPLERQTWLDLRERLAATIRQKCAAHTLVWGPARFQGIWELLETPPLVDANTLAAVHYYTPMGFTHQCENWDRSPLARISGLPFPATLETPAVRALAATFQQAADEEASAFLAQEFSSPWTVARIAADFADAGRWSRTHGCPVILNEFGVLDFCVDPSSRAIWVRAVREAAESNGIGWTYWEVDRGFGFIADRLNTDGFDPLVIEALLGH